MKNNYRYYIIKTAYIIIDLIFIYVSIFLACFLRHETIPFTAHLHTLFIDNNNPFVWLFIFWILATIIFLKANELYQTRREMLEGYEIVQVIKSVLQSTGLLIVLIFLLKANTFPRSVLAISAGFMMFFLSEWRVIKRYFVEYLVTRGYNNFHAVIVGAGKVGLTLYDQIKRKPNLGVKVIGFLDDFKTEISGRKEIRILGKVSDFNRVAKEEFVDQVYITIHNDHNAFLKMLEDAKEMGVATRVIPQGFELISGEFQKLNIGIIPVLEYHDAHPIKHQVGKRLFDFLVSFLSVLILMPVFIIIGIMIKCDNPGPVFYVSRRYGRNGRIFNMLKFRSMVNDADRLQNELKKHNQVDGPIFKIKNDPRITKVGRWLRKYSLDELPQLLNVLLGHMSLVGPRPLPIDQIEKEDLKQLKRLEVRPGITGLWQIRGRSDLPFVRLVKWDIWYINNWSLWLDINILLQTIPVVIKSKGAY